MDYMKMLAFGTGALVTTSAVLLYKFQGAMIYPATMNDARSHVDKPSAFGMPFEELFLDAPDGVKLHTYVLNQNSPKTVVVLCPNAGNIGHSLPIVEVFYKQLHYNVLIYSYRGYGLSTGVPDEKGLKVDADTIMRYIGSHEVLGKTSVILYGRSLGGAVGIYIASKNYDIVKGVILENTFLSIRKAIPHIFPFLAKFTFLCHQVWNSETDIQKVDPNQAKFLFLNGSEDEIVPPDHCKKLFELCGAQDKRHVIFEGRKHNDTVIADGYWDTVADFCKLVDPKELWK